MPDLVLLRTRHFRAQYCQKKDIAIFDNFEPWVSMTIKTQHTLCWFLLRAYLGWSVAKNHNIFLPQYNNIVHKNV